MQTDAQNLSTEKASEKEGAWLQKENENRWRQKRPEEKTRQGQKKTDLLMKNSRGESSAGYIFDKTADDALKQR